MENTGLTTEDKDEGSGTNQPRIRRCPALPKSSVLDQLAADAKETTARTNGAAPDGNGGDQPYVDKKRLAHRYGISERKVDYLREQGVLPWHLIPPRSVRFKVVECDQALERYRRGGGSS